MSISCQGVKVDGAGPRASPEFVIASGERHPPPRIPGPDRLRKLLPRISPQRGQRCLPPRLGLMPLPLVFDGLQERLDLVSVVGELGFAGRVLLVLRGQVARAPSSAISPACAP